MCNFLSKNDFKQMHDEDEKLREEMYEEGHYCDICGELDYTYNFGKDCDHEQMYQSIIHSNMNRGD